jgi:AraC-like DNA-binding protein
VAIYLFSISTVEDAFERNMMKLLIVLFMQIGIKLLVLVWLQNEVVYGKIASAFGLSYGPLLYFTACDLAGRPVDRRHSFFHLLPFLVFSVIYFTLTGGIMTGYIKESMVTTYNNYFMWGVVLSLLTYSLIVRRTLYPMLKGNNPKEMQMKLTDLIAVIFFWGMLTSALLELTPWVKPPVPGFQLRVLPYVFFSAIPVLILRYKLKKLRLRNPAVGKTEVHLLQGEIRDVDVPQEKRYQKSAMSEDAMGIYENRLMEFMEKSRIYLDAELSLERLAKEINIPKHHLTQLLNDRLKKNFYHFINEYRIQEATRRLDQLNGHASETSLLSLAYDCGFNSKSTFNNYFKRITGHTPSSYKKNHPAPSIAV